MISNKQKLLKYSRDLRSDMTKSEIILWNHLRRKQILNLRFNRQKPISKYILDFYCSKIKLAIEIDGSQHFEDNGLEYDSIRDNTLLQSGIRVLRFTNIDIFKNLNLVLEEVYRVCEERLQEL